jgi:hypothetical protein
MVHLSLFTKMTHAEPLISLLITHFIIDEQIKEKLCIKL